MEEIASVKRQIKEWEHEFKRHNNRAPSKQDVKQNENIHNLYKTYRQMKESSKVEPTKQEALAEQSDPLKAASVSKLNRPVAQSPVKAQVDIKFIGQLTDDEFEDEQSLKQRNVELGPTPQANGKILSILDMRFTPPDSSPIKSRIMPGHAALPVISVNSNGEIFKTPTKARIERIEFQSPIRSVKRKSINEKLLSLGNPTTPVETVVTPVKRSQERSREAAYCLDTPQYLGKRNSQVAFGSSPVKLLNSSSLLTTPVKLTSPIPFSVSPSPLKPHRFLSKKLSDVFNDFKSIQEEMLEDDEFAQDFLDAEQLEQELDMEAADGVVRKRKKFTQKRTTRRWKIKPRLGELGDDKFEHKNIHKAIAKINKEKQGELESYMKEGEEEVEEEESESESEQVYTRKEPENTKGMIKPISNNYQRLKINDPRTKAFKRRMKR